MSKPAVEARSLGCRAGGRVILSDISFTAQKGEFLAVIGPNGAGKSTLLRTLGGINREHTGYALIDGTEISSLSARETARRIAWLHQDSGNIPDFTVRRFAMMSRYPWRPVLSAETAEDSEAADTAIAAAGISELANRRIASLSGGERQLAMLAAAAAQGSETLFLDEPAGALDYERLAAAEEFIVRLHKEGRTVLMVTHDINQALRCADEVLALRGGTQLWKGPSAGLTDGKLLAALYGTEFEFFQKPGRHRPYAVPACMLR